MEGRLAANTFQVFPYITTEEIVTLLSDQFQVDILDAFAQLKATSEHDWDRILTMASLLQREARGLEEMRVVAGLFERRLAEGLLHQLMQTTGNPGIFCTEFQDKQTVWLD